MIIGNAVRSIILPSQDLYLIKDGVFQNGFAYADWTQINNKRYTSSESTSSSTISVTAGDGYISFRGSSAQNRRSAVIYSPAITTINDYSYLIIRCKRIHGSSAANMRLGMYNNDINQFAKYCFYGTNPSSSSVTGDSVESTSNDANPVTLQITLNYCLNQQTPVSFAWAQAIVAGHTNGVDLYDVYLTRTPLT